MSKISQNEDAVSLQDERKPGKLFMKKDSEDLFVGEKDQYYMQKEVANYNEPQRKFFPNHGYESAGSTNY